MSNALNVLYEAEGLTEFFGAPPNKVNYFLRYIVININYRPDWLRGRPTLKDLPRYGLGTQADTIKIATPKRNPRLLSRDIIWIVECLKGRWVLEQEGFLFENLADATLFKLRL